MGTSSSSKGPSSKVNLIPSWTPPLPTPTVLQTPTAPVVPNDGAAIPQNVSIPVVNMPAANPTLNTPNLSLMAPERRFGSARTNLGRYSQTGSKDDLKRGLGHYVKKGLGGSKAATRRMSRTAHAAGNLVNVLSALSQGQPLPAQLGLDVKALQGMPVNEIADHIANAIHPTDGTQDAEAGRNAMSLALSELLEVYPTADLLSLDEEQITLVTESYISHDLCHRIELDVFKAVLDKAKNHVEASKRLEQMTDFVREHVSSSLRSRIEKGEKILSNTVASLAASILNDTFDVFESWI